MSGSLRFEDIAEGQEVGPLLKTPTHVSMFMYSAAVWLVHRIHYDHEFATDHEGLPDVVVHGTLATDWYAQLLLEWAGRDARLARLSYQIRSYMLPDQTLTCGGSVVRMWKEDGERNVELRLWIRREDGVEAVSGSAMVQFASAPAT